MKYDKDAHPDGLEPKTMNQTVRCGLTGEPPMMPSYDDTNVFSRILRDELPSYRIYETDRVLAFMDVMPRGEGHTLVIPKAKARNILDANPDDLAELIKAVQIVARASKAAFGADGITIQQFNEGAGGQVVFHLHVHIIPRFIGVALKPHTGKMEDPQNLARNAEMIRAALAKA